MMKIIHVLLFGFLASDQLVAASCCISCSGYTVCGCSVSACGASCCSGSCCGAPREPVVLQEDSIQEKKGGDSQRVGLTPSLETTKTGFSQDLPSKVPVYFEVRSFLAGRSGLIGRRASLPLVTWATCGPNAVSGDHVNFVGRLVKRRSREYADGIN